MILRRLCDRLRPPRQLRWKLTLSHTLVTVAALVTVEILVIAGGLYFVRSNTDTSPAELFADLETHYLPLAQYFLAEPAPGVDGYALKLGELHYNLPPKSRPILILGNLEIDMTSYDLREVYFIRADGVLMNVIPYESVAASMIGQRFDARKIPSIEQPLEAALRGVEDYRQLYTVRLPDYRVVGALPVWESSSPDHLLGAVAFATKSFPGQLWFLEGLLPWMGISLVFFTALAGAAGTLFGSLTARGLVRRLRTMSESTHAWSRGDFTADVQDAAGDELGELASELNRMAKRLEHLLDQRQELSVMEERNRLARDLHDSAKQQAFAASAQLATARALWRQNSEAAEAHLQEAEVLVDRVRQELTDLIQELRPPTFKGGGLAAALHEYALDWGHQNGIRITTQLCSDGELPPESEQTLFRIAQEALANVARHSHANRVLLSLENRAQQVCLTVQDNGCGFDSSLEQFGVGLCSMRERARIIGGCLSIVSASGSGTTVEVTVPE
jgi:two-component system, NarL family, sensor histidine kinase LiaS